MAANPTPRFALSDQHFQAVRADLDSNRFPKDVGILAMEVYFPKTFVSQEQLEVFSGVAAGKFTIGLGQDQLAFLNDREDIYSISLTVVSNLMEKYGIRYEDIGRLEVGTETIIDHSKSVKSVILQLFKDSGNSELEGIDNVHACYGGTNALFNAISWVESSSWNGKYAIVVSADIAEYAKGPARPTGGVGAVAMLIGPNASLVFERGIRATHMEHAYDFYKPRLSSPYPVVDGHFSNVCYLRSLDICYQKVLQRLEERSRNHTTLNNFDFVAFHSPYNKLVQKSLARMLYNDYLRDPTNPVFEGFEKFKDISLDESYTNKDLEKALGAASKKLFSTKVGPSTLLPKKIGNMYTASLYASLASVLYNQGSQLAGKSVLLFSYGSGLASSMFLLRGKETESAKADLANIRNVLNLEARLAARAEKAPEEFATAMLVREELHTKDSYKPTCEPSELFPGTFFLTEKDEQCRRSYSRV